MRAEKLREVLAPRSWARKLETLDGRRATVFLYLFINHIYYPLRDHYLSKYHQAGSYMPESLTSSWISIKVKRQKSSATIDQNSEVAREPEVDSWHFRAFPRMWPTLVWYRIVTSAWMVYVLLKNGWPIALESLLGSLELEKPPSCYLLGRFLPDVGYRRANACLFAGHHLIWRSSQLFVPRKNYMISTWYFLMLDDRDITRYYRVLDELHRRDHRGDMNRLRARSRELDASDQLFHDIMSLRVNPPSGGAPYKLRPNRTPEASGLLRKYLLDKTLLGTAIFVPMALVITLFLSFRLFNYQRYLQDYPGCSPRPHELHERSLQAHHPRGHLPIALIADGIENAILWTESGLAGVFSIVHTMLLNYDLRIYWKYLDDKIARMLLEIRGAANQNSDSLRCQNMRRLVVRDSGVGPRDEIIYELQMEWQDFIKQIKQADAFIGDATTDFLFVWFSIFGVCIHDSMYSQETSIPIALKLTLAFLVIVVSGLCVSLVVLQRRCLTSYTKLCSLMAYDRSEYKLNFIQIMDYFTRERACFTLMRKYKIKGTTCITIVGWSFSCYFILASITRV